MVRLGNVAGKALEKRRGKRRINNEKKY